MEDVANTSGCSHQLETLKLSEASLARGGSSKASDNPMSQAASDADLATKCSSLLSEVEGRIEQSKSHWSTLAHQSGAKRGTQVRPRRKWQKLIFCCFNKEYGEVAEVSNVKVFKDLQKHPTWGGFFEKPDNFAEFEMGEKFAEGAQAELFDVRIKWGDPSSNEYVQKGGIEYVLKVFKKGTFLQDLQFQVPHGYLDFCAYVQGTGVVELNFPRFQSEVHRGVLLKDGRFAFLMEKEHFDLRYVIERNMKSKSSVGRGPFSKEESEVVMYRVALGVDFLHSHNIIHRDLKASNVLVKEFAREYPEFLCFVADYESSIGVIGTGFFRAPEILQACKDQKVWERPEVFSKAADIYSYGMVCYEILTGKLPFEGHLPNDYDLVLNGQCLEVPDYIEGWTYELLKKCWHLNPMSRPGIREILDIFLVHSIEARKVEEDFKNRYGHNYRDWSSIEI